MVKFIGIDSGKVYVIGNTKKECFRKLQKKYPYKTVRKKQVTNEPVYPEPLLVVKA